YVRESHFRMLIRGRGRQPRSSVASSAYPTAHEITSSGQVGEQNSARPKETDQATFLKKMIARLKICVFAQAGRQRAGGSLDGDPSGLEVGAGARVRKLRPVLHWEGPR